MKWGVVILSKEMGNQRSKRLALIVEDNELNRDMLAAILEDDFEIIQAENGLVGIEKLEGYHEELSIILLDVYMPVCDGLEFLRRRREHEQYRAIPVIVTTAGNSLEEERACLELGANDFVAKPYDPTIIKNRISNMVHLRESASIVNQLRWDDMTGLYTKRFFNDAVEDEFASNPEGQFDIVCSDIENFKDLNDRYGELNCDRLLRELAGRLTSRLPGLVAAGRIGGDTFAFLIRHQEEEWHDCLYSITEGLPYGNLSINIGIIECVDKSNPVATICNKAMSAIETVKGRLGVKVVWFDDEMRKHQMTEQIILDTMEEALDERQFVVHFQPKHDVRKNVIGGAEALVRWIHPVLGFVNPGLFITMFERNGFITKLDLYVLEETCREIKRCQERGLPVVPISVNISRLDFDVPDLPQRIVDVVDRYGIDHALIHVELTETAYSDNPETVKAMLRELKVLGFSSELDDFGAGYSSLVSLNMLPLDVMKLDMSMIRQATELDDFRIVESAIRIAQMLDMQSVVEGVETADEAEKVIAMGCDYIQGYFYSRPLPLDDFEAYLEASGLQ